MTKTYQYTFHVLKKKPETTGRDMSDWYEEEITLTKRVTDRMEERPGWKAIYAANYFEHVIRTQYGKPRHLVMPKWIKEV